MDAATVSAYFSGQVMTSLVAMTTILILGVVIIAIFEPSKSKKYREILTDLYVAGKVRQFATEDKVDLDIEKVNFERWSKKQLLNDKGLGRTIEENLKEKVIEDSLKKVNKSKK